MKGRELWKKTGVFKRGRRLHPLPFYGSCSLCSLGPQGSPSFRAMTSIWLCLHEQNHHALVFCPVGSFNACFWFCLFVFVSLFFLLGCHWFCPQTKVEARSRKEFQRFKPCAPLLDQWADPGRNLFSGKTPSSRCFSWKTPRCADVR